MIPKSKLKKLQKDLKGKSVLPVAKKLKISEVSVFNALMGRTENNIEYIIEALVEYRDELAIKSKQLADRI